MKKKNLSEPTNNISKEGNELIFEIGNEITTDVAEAISILMRKTDNNDKIWETKTNNEEINPSKCLYWLTGGHDEWKNLDHYAKPWSEVMGYYEEEYSTLIIKLYNNSKTWKEVRDKFRRYLNLPRLYEFALANKIIIK